MTQLCKRAESECHIVTTHFTGVTKIKTFPVYFYFELDL